MRFAFAFLLYSTATVFSDSFLFYIFNCEHSHTASDWLAATSENLFRKRKSQQCKDNCLSIKNNNDDNNNNNTVNSKNNSNRSKRTSRNHSYKTISSFSNLHKCSFYGLLSYKHIYKIMKTIRNTWHCRCTQRYKSLLN